MIYFARNSSRGYAIPAFEQNRTKLNSDGHVMFQKNRREFLKAFHKMSCGVAIRAARVLIRHWAGNTRARCIHPQHAKTTTRRFRNIRFMAGPPMSPSEARFALATARSTRVRCWQASMSASGKSPTGSGLSVSRIMMQASSMKRRTGWSPWGTTHLLQKFYPCPRNKVFPM